MLLNTMYFEGKTHLHFTFTLLCVILLADKTLKHHQQCNRSSLGKFDINP